MLNDKMKREIKRKVSKRFIYISKLAEYASYRFSQTIWYDSICTMNSGFQKPVSRTLDSIKGLDPY